MEEWKIPAVRPWCIQVALIMPLAHLVNEHFQRDPADGGPRPRPLLSKVLLISQFAVGRFILSHVLYHVYSLLPFTFFDVSFFRHVKL